MDQKNGFQGIPEFNYSPQNFPPLPTRSGFKSGDPYMRAPPQVFPSVPIRSGLKSDDPYMINSAARRLDMDREDPFVKILDAIKDLNNQNQVIRNELNCLKSQNENIPTNTPLPGNNLNPSSKNYVNPNVQFRV